MTIMHATAGAIASVSTPDSQPGPLSLAERAHLQTLAAQVREIAERPEQERKRELWYQHIRLARTKPMVLVFPENSWEEILPPEILTVSDPFWRQLEWYLRHLIYRAEHLCDDFVIEPAVFVSTPYRMTGWGLTLRHRHSGMTKGAWAYDPPLKDPEDIVKLTSSEAIFDTESGARHLQAVHDVVGHLLTVQPAGAPLYLLAANLIGTVTALRGIEQTLLDMVDRPVWLHRLMAFVTESQHRLLHQLEAQGLLQLNNRHHYVDSGGISYTDELPQPGMGSFVRLRDLWGFGVAQELSHVSPAMHDEFVLQYQIQLLEHFGINSYGCCEPLTTKFAIVKQVPRLRRVSVSPWCDVSMAAAALGRDYILSWKPNPALILGPFDEERIRSYIRHAFRETAGCAVEAIHKDSFTIERDPIKLIRWAQIAQEEAERVA